MVKYYLKVFKNKFAISLVGKEGTATWVVRPKTYITSQVLEDLGKEITEEEFTILYIGTNKTRKFRMA